MNRTARNTAQAEGPSRFSLALLGAMQGNRNIYSGSVPAGVIVERRRKNKAARKSRRINRGGK